MYIVQYTYHETCLSSQSRAPTPDLNYKLSAFRLLSLNIVMAKQFLFFVRSLEIQKVI